jgi:hypothetical protein
MINIFFTFFVIGGTFAADWSYKNEGKIVVKIMILMKNVAYKPK